MNRTDRLLSIVLALQTQRWQRAEDLAEMLEVSTRTIYRDMQALNEAGVPVEAVPGKGYSLYESYFLTPLTLTTDEAIVLLLGSDYVAQHFAGNHRAAARSAYKKIEAILPEQFQEQVDSLRDSIRFVPTNVFDHPSEQTRLRTLRRALMEQRAVRFRYRKRSPTNDAVDATEHTVKPYGLLQHSGTWSLIGYSQTERRVQHFRLRRIENLHLLDETYERPAGYQMPRLTEDEAPEVTVHVLFDPEVAPWVEQTSSPHIVATEQRTDGLLATLRVRRETELIPWLLGWGAHVYVLEPVSLRRRVAHEAEKIAERYRTEPLLLS